MSTGDNLKRDGRPSLLQIRYLIELKKLQPVKRGFQVVIAERCHVSRPGINKSLKKAIEQGLITQYYTFTDYGEEWIKSYENLIVRLEKYLDDIDIPESEREKHIRMMVEDMDPFLVESILSAHEELVKPQNRKYKSLMKGFEYNIEEGEHLPVRIVVYRMTRRKNGESPFSMGNRAFDSTAELTKENGDAYLLLHPCEMQARSRLDGKIMTGKIRSLKYEHNGVLQLVEELREGAEVIKLPLEAFKIHIGTGGEIKGILPITVTCSVGNGHMPESTALLVFWM